MGSTVMLVPYEPYAEGGAKIEPTGTGYPPQHDQHGQLVKNEDSTILRSLRIGLAKAPTCGGSHQLLRWHDVVNFAWWYHAPGGQLATRKMSQPTVRSVVVWSTAVSRASALLRA